MRKHYIQQILPGDKVKVELSPYDLTRGRITTTGTSNQESSLKVPSVREADVRTLPRVIRRHGRVMVICSNPNHKQRQG